mgnify:CR=1 FL=1
MRPAKQGNPDDARYEHFCESPSAGIEYKKNDFRLEMRIRRGMQVFANFLPHKPESAWLSVQTPLCHSKAPKLFSTDLLKLDV